MDTYRKNDRKGMLCGSWKPLDFKRLFEAADADFLKNRLGELPVFAVL